MGNLRLLNRFPGVFAKYCASHLLLWQAIKNDENWHHGDCQCHFILRVNDPCNYLNETFSY